MSMDITGSKTYIHSCRICLDSMCLNMVLLNEQNGWLSLFEYCFTLQLSTEDEPRLLCKQCADKVKSYSNFKEQCLKSDSLWRSVILNAKCCIENNIFDIEVKNEDLEDSTLNVNDSDDANDEIFKNSPQNYSNYFNDQEAEALVSSSEIKIENINDVVSSEHISFKSININSTNETHSKQKCLEDIQTENCNDNDKAKEKEIYTCKKCMKKYELKKCFLKHVKICKSKKLNNLNTNYHSVSHRVHEFNCGKKYDSENVNTVNNSSVARITNKLESDICIEGDMQPKLLNILEVDASEKDGNENNNKTLYFCGLCLHTATSNIDASKHLNQHWSNNDLSCSLCDFVGVDLAAISAHRYIHFPPKHKTPFLCHICMTRKLSLLALHFHYRQVHLKRNGGFCSQCNKEFSKLRSWKRHERTHINGGFVCDTCGKRYLYKHLIIEHMLDHCDPKKYVCDACGKRFTRARYLRLHMSAVHAKTGPMKCSHCNRMFKSEHTLKIHQQIYARKKYAKCLVCSKEFPSLSMLKSHMAMHSDERPYCCDICGARYKAKCSLKIHMRRHSGYLPHRCALCDKGFPTPRQLRVHRGSAVHGAAAVRGSAVHGAAAVRGSAVHGAAAVRGSAVHGAAAVRGSAVHGAAAVRGSAVHGAAAVRVSAVHGAAAVRGSAVHGAAAVRGSAVHGAAAVRVSAVHGAAARSAGKGGLDAHCQLLHQTVMAEGNEGLE